MPDVAYNAGQFGGVITAWYVLDGAVPPPGQFGSFFIFGGTSAGAPQWSAITALADQKAGHRVGSASTPRSTTSPGRRTPT